MSQSGYTPILIYSSATTTNVPLAANLSQGELAINTADGKLFYKDSGGTVQVIATKAGALGTVTSVSGTGTVNGLTLTGTVTTSGSLTLGGTLDLSSPPAIGGTAAAAGSFTALSYTTTLTGGTGIVNLGSGQFYKDASGNVMIGTTTPRQSLTVAQNNSVGMGVEISNLSTSSVTTKFAGVYFSGFDTVGTYKPTALIASNPDDINYVNSNFTISTRIANTLAERMRIDSSGNVGIGTSSPSTYGKLAIVQEGNNAAFIGTSTTLTNYISADIAYICAAPTIGSSATSKNIVFQTGSSGLGTERMRIDASGNVLIGTTAQLLTEKMAVKSTSTYVATFQNVTNTSGYSGIYSSIGSAGNNTSTFHFQGNTNAVGNWYLYGNGTMSYSSDQRLKKNIETTRDGYIDDLCKLRVVKYNWKNDEEGKPKELGLIAQEVEQVFPNLVQDDIGKISEDDDTVYKQLKSSVLPYMLLKAIQELKAIVDTQAEQIKALQGAK